MSQAEYHGKVVTLQVEEGNKPGQPIGTYVAGRRERYLVFLPGNAPVGQQVRVKLADTGRTDKRDCALYRGLPETEYTNRWKDNGDGTTALTTIASDWLFQESEEGEVETRKLETRENADRVSNSIETKLIWGQDQASTTVEVVEVKSFPTEVEAVENGTIVWKTTSWRQEFGQPQQVAVSDIQVSGEWRNNCMKVVYEPQWQCSVTFRCQRGNSTITLAQAFRWDELPLWLQSSFSEPYPICPCNRSRYLRDNPDGYQKCDLCRQKEMCVRCTKKTRITNHAGRYICSNCEPRENAEEAIRSGLSAEQRLKFATHAQLLLSTNALPGEVGEIILETTLTHLTNDSVKQSILNKWKGYRWYYFTGAGVFATKFSPEALQLISLLQTLSGNGLVEVVAWLNSGVKPTSSDYYLQTQEEKQTPSLPSFGSWVSGLTIEAVAIRLRDSEQARIQALETFNRLQAIHGDHKDIVEAKRLLIGEEQAYEKALALCRNAETYLAERQQKILSGEILPDFVAYYDQRGNRRQTEDFWAIAADGSMIGHGSDGEKATFGDLPATALVLSHGYTSKATEEWWTAHHLPKKLTAEQRHAASELETDTRQYFTGAAAGWQFTKVGVNRIRAEYDGSTQEELDAYNEMCGNLPIDVSQQDTESGEDETLLVYSRVRMSPQQKRVGSLQQQLTDIYAARDKAGATEKDVRGRLVATDKFVLDVFYAAQKEKLYVKPDQEDWTAKEARNTKRRDVARNGQVCLMNLQWDESKGEWFSEFTVGSKKLETERTVRIAVQPYPDFWPEKPGEYYCEGNMMLFLSRNAIGILVNVLGPKNPKAYFEPEIKALRAEVAEAEAVAVSTQERVSGEQLKSVAEMLMEKWGGKK